LSRSRRTHYSESSRVDVSNRSRRLAAARLLQPGERDELGWWRPQALAHKSREEVTGRKSRDHGLASSSDAPHRCLQQITNSPSIFISHVSLEFINVRTKQRITLKNFQALTSRQIHRNEKEMLELGCVTLFGPFASVGQIERMNFLTWLI